MHGHAATTKAPCDAVPNVVTDDIKLALRSTSPIGFDWATLLPDAVRDKELRLKLFRVHIEYL